MGLSAHDYDKLESDDIECRSSISESQVDFEPSKTNNSISTRKALTALLQMYGLLLLATALLFALWLFLDTRHTVRPAASPASQTRSCGDTTIEARNRSCAFDILSYSWMPEECMDHETAAEFKEWLYSPDRQYGPFPFFKDKSATDRVENEEALSERLGAETRTTQEEHIGHCVFLARRLARARDGVVRVGLSVGLHHNLHCNDEILKAVRLPPMDNDRLHSAFGVGFDSCIV